MVLSVVLLLRKNDAVVSIDQKDRNTLIVSLLIWLLVVSPFVIMGVRFVQLLALPSCLLVGYIFGVASDNFGNEILDIWKKDVCIILIAALLGGSLAVVNGYFAIIAALFCLIVGLVDKTVTVNKILAAFLTPTFLCMMVDGYYTVKNTTPYIPDDIYNAVEIVNDTMSTNSVVISWWDIGYYLQYATNRQVVSDGGIYNGEYFYWLANIFTTDNPKLSAGICNMLKGGNMDAARIARLHTDSDEKSAELLKDILVLEKSDAYDLLKNKYHFTESEAKEMIDFSHPDVEKEVYVLVSQDTLLKTEIIAYFGLWNFKDEKEYKLSYDYDEDKMIFPKELKDSVLLNLYFEESLEGFEEVFSNNTVRVFTLE